MHRRGEALRMRTALQLVLFAVVAGAAARAAAAAPPPPPRASCDAIADFGAAGDNRTEDTAAVAAALAACSTVLLRAGSTFLLRPVEVPSHRHLVIDGTIAAWRDVWTWPNSTNKVCPVTPYEATPQQLAPQLESLLWGEGVTNVTISGVGTVDGQGGVRWWRLRTNMTHGDYWHNCRPKLLDFGRGDRRGYGTVTDLTVTGVTLKDSPFWTLTARGLRRGTFRDVKVTTTGCGYAEAPNTDGFNLQGEDIVIEHCTVRNGDDCVPLFPPTRNVTVRNVSCECGNPPVAVIWPYLSKAGGGGDITDVTFDRVRLNRTSSAVAIKALPSFVGRAVNVSFTNYELHEVGIGLAINFFGQGTGNGGGGNGGGGNGGGSGGGGGGNGGGNGGGRGGSGGRGSGGAPLGAASAVGILVENVTGTVVGGGPRNSTAAAGHINCQADQPCSGLRLVNVVLTTAVGEPAAPFECESAAGSSEGCSPVPCGW